MLLHRALIGLVVAFAAVSFVVSQREPSVFIISSVNGTDARLRPGTPIRLNATRIDSAPLLKFDLSQTYQVIHGFGGAMTEAVSDNLDLIGAVDAERILRAYYDAEDGNCYTVTRVPMNSCDFTRASYNFDNVTDDFDLVNFDTRVTHDAKTFLPYIQRAIAISRDRLNLFLTPWSPPGWFKGNGQMDGSSRPGLKADPRYHTAWANYFVAFLRAYQTYNISFWGLTVQNEPENAGAWESCVFNPSELRDFIGDYLGPIVHKAFPDIRIMQHDHNKDHCVIFADTVFADDTASSHVWGTAIHWYSGSQFDLVQQLHDHWPQKHILATEACNCGGVHLDDWQRGESYAIDILGDLNAWSVGWTDWNIVLDNRGGPNHLGNLCDAPVITRFDVSPAQVHYQPNYFILGHFSRFLSPGALRINHTVVGSTSVQFTTFRVDLDRENPLHSQLRRLVGADAGTYVVAVLFNTAGFDLEIQLAVGKAFATVRVPKHSIHTIAFDAQNLHEADTAITHSDTM